MHELNKFQNWDNCDKILELNEEYKNYKKNLMFEKFEESER